MPATIFRALVLAALTMGSLVTQAPAATVAAFEKVTNDGVFTLTAAQVKYFAVEQATHVAFFRPRTKNDRALFSVGTIFTALSLRASCKSDCGNILSVRNGRNPDLAYAGGYLGALTTATAAKAGSGYYAGLAFFFKGTKSINFAGGGNFNAGQARLPLDFVVPAEVPLPASLPLLAGALALIGLARRRRA